MKIIIGTYFAVWVNKILGHLVILIKQKKTAQLLSRGYHHMLASWAEKWQKNLPKEKQLNKILTHKPFIVTQVQNKRNKYSSGRNTFHIT